MARALAFALRGSFGQKVIDVRLLQGFEFNHYRVSYSFIPGALAVDLIGLSGGGRIQIENEGKFLAFSWGNQRETTSVITRVDLPGSAAENFADRPYVALQIYRMRCDRYG